MPSTPSVESPLVVAVERALRANGFFILGRHWEESGACVIKFRAMLSPHIAFRLNHELLIDATPERIDERAGELRDYIGAHRTQWAPLLEALAN